MLNQYIHSLLYVWMSETVHCETLFWGDLLKIIYHDIYVLYIIIASSSGRSNFEFPTTCQAEAQSRRRRRHFSARSRTILPTNSLKNPKDHK